MRLKNIYQNKNQTKNRKIMKTKIKLITMIVLAMGLLQVSAQQGEHKPPSIEERIKRVTESLEKEIELSDSQKEIIQRAYTEFFKTTDKLMQSGQRPEKSVMEKHESERDTKIKKALSKEKYEQYLNISRSLKPKHSKKGEHPQKQQ